MVDSKADLTARLQASHLPSTAQLKGELEKEFAKEETPDPNDDPKAKPEYTFDFEHVDARGNVWKGRFTHRVPTLADRDMIDALQARKKLSMPVESFTGMAAARHLYMSHLEVCLIERPKWADNLESLYDPEILEKLYEEAASHEAYFLGWGARQSGSEG